MNVDEALAYWERKKLLTPAKAAELRASVHQDHPSRAIALFTAVGAILIGLGIILFVGSHWGEINPTVKVVLLLLTMVGTGKAGYFWGYERTTYPKTGLALLFVNVFAYGATIFLVGQIYHLSLTWWWGMLLWCAGTALFAYILKSRMHLWMAVPLFLVFIGWLQTSHIGAGELNFLFDDRVRFLSLLAPLGLFFLSLGVLHERSKATAFGAQTLFHWGLFQILVLVVVTTVDKSVFFHYFQYPFDGVGIGLLVLAGIAFVSALLWGGFRTREGRGGLIALALYLAFLFVIGWVPRWMGIDLGTSYFLQNQYLGNSPALTWLYVLHIFLAFALELTIIWYGTLLRRPIVINLGIVAIAVTIIIQYFSWVFEMLPRSFAFIIGGAVILGLGTVLERQRRKLVSSLSA